MSAMPAAKIRDPEELYSPDFPPSMVDDILEGLNEAGGREFFRQVHEASEKARVEGDLRYLNEVFESWYRTLIFASGENADLYWQQAQEDKSEGYTAEELRRKRLAGRPTR